MSETVYIAIYQNENMTVQIEYQPLANGLIEILNLHVAPRLLDTVFEQRQQARRRYKWQPTRRGIDSDPRDEP